MAVSVEQKPAGQTGPDHRDRHGLAQAKTEFMDLRWASGADHSGQLSDADVATLKHLAAAGMGANSLRALASDLACLERWALAATGSPLPWPAPAGLVAKFIAHHLWDPLRKAADSAHGMPQDVIAALATSGSLRSQGPHAPATVQRRLHLWATLHGLRGLTGPFGDPHIRAALRLAVRAARRPNQRKSKMAMTGDVIAAMVATTVAGSLVDLRDRALILTGFASGGRRRSELAGLRVEQIKALAPVAADSPDPASPALPCLQLSLGRTKTSNAGDDAHALLIGRPAEALLGWLVAAEISEGAVFRAIDKWGHLDAAALSPQSINLILKRRAAMAGLDPADFSAHGLRSGYLTEAARQGVSLPEAMQQSQHKSLQQAARYYNDAGRRAGRAARLVI